MIGLESLRIALSGLLANKLRSSLTILGMTIGVGSVIILIAVGNGSSRAIQKRIEALGTNVLLVLRVGGFGGSRTNTSQLMPLTQGDAQALSDPVNAPDVLTVSPVVNASVTAIYNGVSYQPGQFQGSTPSYSGARNYTMAAGSFFGQDDLTAHRRVVVLGPTVVTNLFGASNPVGQTVQINGASFQVIGVTNSKGSNGALDQDDFAVAPLSAVQDTLTGYGNLNQIIVQARSRQSLDAASNEVTAILDQRHRITNGRNTDFRVINQGAILQTSSTTSDVFTTLLGEVAAISLLVGGIGVMNIMLVSVTERTREIGIRKAIGARHSDILSQFLIEAVLVSLFGGVLGVLVGVIGSQFTIAGVHPVVALYSIFLAFGAAVAAGLFFGTYPASRAAGLQPIEALRFE
ncbi:MAG: FtsX-like permease family protein [Actinobacteria bacterium]|nr:MAG: FtsX-like permease family protein [Actinomycetota bacterium]